MLLMLKELFINVLIIVSYIFIGANVMKEKSINKNSSLNRKFLFGICGAFMAISLMLFTIKIVGTNTIIDFRFFPLILVFYFSGIIPTLITGLGIIFYRIGFFGVNSSSILASINIVLYVILYFIVDKTNIKSKIKIWIYYFISILIFIPTIYFQIKNTSNYISIITLYTVSSFLAFSLTSYLIKYVETSNNLYRKYKEQAIKDFLTGLYNTRQYDLLFNNISNNIVKNDGFLAFLLIDIDFFKKINDTYGHNIGDLILVQLSDLLKKHCKSSDIISRIGGEEFCILSLGNDLEKAKVLAEALRKLVEEHQFTVFDDQTINITISIGLSVYPDLTTDVNKLKELADNALYISKNSGRNRVSY